MSTHFYSSVGGDESTQRFFSRTKLPLSWPTMPTILPHRLRRKFRSTKSKMRSRQSPASSITSLQTSFNPADTLKSLRTHQWSYYDAQYLLLAVLGIFSLCVIQHPGPFVKTIVASLLMLSLVLPITRQFFLPFLPVASWLIFFYACGYVQLLRFHTGRGRLTLRLQIHLWRIPTSDLGPSATNPRKHHVRRQSVKYHVCAQSCCLGRHSLDPLRSHPFWRSICRFWYFVHLRPAWNDTCICKSFWIHESGRCSHPAHIPLRSTLV